MGYRGIDIREVGDRLLFEAVLMDPVTGVPVTAPETPPLVVLVEFQNDGSTKTYDFNDNTFKTNNVTSPTANLIEQQISAGLDQPVPIGLFSYMQTVLTGLTIGKMYKAIMLDSTVAVCYASQTFQYGSGTFLSDTAIQEIAQIIYRRKVQFVNPDGDDTNGISPATGYNHPDDAITATANGGAIIMMPGTYNTAADMIDISAKSYIDLIGGGRGVQITDASNAVPITLGNYCRVYDLYVKQAATTSTGGEYAIQATSKLGIGLHGVYVDSNCTSIILDGCKNVEVSDSILLGKEAALGFVNSRGTVRGSIIRTDDWETCDQAAIAIVNDNVNDVVEVIDSHVYARQSTVAGGFVCALHVMSGVAVLRNSTAIGESTVGSAADGIRAGTAGAGEVYLHKATAKGLSNVSASQHDLTMADNPSHFYLDSGNNYQIVSANLTTTYLHENITAVKTKVDAAIDADGNLTKKVLGGGSGTISGTGVRAVDASGNPIAKEESVLAITGGGGGGLGAY